MRKKIILFGTGVMTCVGVYGLKLEYDFNKRYVKVQQPPKYLLTSSTNCSIARHNINNHFFLRNKWLHNILPNFIIVPFSLKVFEKKGFFFQKCNKSNVFQIKVSDVYVDKLSGDIISKNSY